jgi:hypothetical protein
MIGNLKTSLIQNSLGPMTSSSAKDSSALAKSKTPESSLPFADALKSSKKESNKELSNKEVNREPTKAKNKETNTEAKSEAGKVTYQKADKTSEQKPELKSEQKPEQNSVKQTEAHSTTVKTESPKQPVKENDQTNVVAKQSNASEATSVASGGKQPQVLSEEIPAAQVDANSKLNSAAVTSQADVTKLFMGLAAANEAIPTNAAQDLSQSEDVQLLSSSDSEVIVPLHETQDVMTDFLEELKNKLGVQPEDLVAAMAALSPQDLQLPPEKNVEKIIENLNLKPHQKVEAKKLFQEMVIKTEYTRWADFIKASGQDLNADLMTNAELGKEATNKKIDRMNAAFFMNTQNLGPAAQAPANAQKALAVYANQSGVQSGQAIPKDMTLVDEQSTDKKSDKAQDFSKFFAPAIGAGLTTGASAAKESVRESGSVSKKALEDLISKAVEQQSANSNSVNSNESDNSSLNDSSDESLNNLMSELGITETKAESADVSSDFAQVLNPSGAAVKAQDKAAPAFGIGASTMNMTDAQKKENVGEVIQSARMLAEDGGGEMRIRMNPDQMGEVNLKVNVKDGNVNVEIITETAEAKKLFERGLGDLKANLSAHKLNVDGIKIDTAQNLANEFMQQNSQQQERGAAQHFLQQFKQDNQSWRSGFLDQGARKPSSQIEDKADMTVGSARKPNSARKLDLVA